MSFISIYKRKITPTVSPQPSPLTLEEKRKGLTVSPPPLSIEGKIGVTVSPPLHHHVIMGSVN